VKYNVKIEQVDEGYAVWCPGLPGCWSQVRTEEEALGEYQGRHRNLPGDGQKIDKGALND